MLKISRHSIIRFLYFLIDIFFMVVSIYLATLIRKSTLPFPITLNYLYLDPINPYRFIFLLWILVAVYFNNSHRLYETKRELIETMEIWKIIRAVFVTNLVIVVAIYVLKVVGFPRSIVLLVAIFMIIFFTVWRLVKRSFVDFLVSKGYNNFNVLIIGAGRVGKALVQEINKRPGLGLRVIGFLDNHKSEASAKDGMPKVIGTIDDFHKIAQKEFIHEIFITGHHDESVFLQLIRSAKELNISIRVIPHGFEMISGGFVQYNIGLIPVFEYNQLESRKRTAFKRSFDVTLSLMGIVILLPVLCIIALAVKLDSRGPVLYFSKRYGRKGHKFSMIKFRSMVKDADKILDKYKDKNEVDGPIFKMKKDPRVTRVGRFLRRYSLDELPQLFNVLLGNMSLVGPRPLPISQVQRDDIRQVKRLEVKPGITGLWQIRGRSDASFYRLVKWDVWYINNWSLGLDFQILLQTIPAVLKGRGAY